MAPVKGARCRIIRSMKEGYAAWSAFWERNSRVAPFIIACLAIIVSAIARGADFILTPLAGGGATINAIAMWANPNVLGVLLIIFGFGALIGLITRAFAFQAVFHMALAALFLVMGLVSFGPIVTTLGWGWRAPISYLSYAVFHWFFAHSWFNRWVVRRGRTHMDP